tara:strand:- start:13 stop:717 length:705 start_codon:yes stop_codon:yes gene_type:complete
MIISYSNNFVAIRPPKTGSTSLAFYFLNSGLVDFEKDVYAISNDFKNGGGEKFKLVNEEFKKTYLSNVKKIARSAKESNVHRTFEDLRVKSAIQATMPCVSTIRNPLERISSIFSYEKFVRNQAGNYIDEELENPNTFWDFIQTEQRKYVFHNAQCSYFPEHAELFNTENLHEHVSKYILEKGGKVDSKIKMRKNPDNKLDVFLTELTPDRKQDILDTYAKDFELWEKAYAVYN